jgi:hypothetical protein
MDEKVPRRMMRFYRTAEQKKEQYNNEYNAPYRDQNSGRVQQNRQQKNEEENESPTGRSILSHIPTMDYEDVNLEMDQKNAEEFKQIQQKNLEEKLALNEIEKFKKENKRLPNQKESDAIAENLFTQLKNSNITELAAEKGLTGQVAPQGQSQKRGRRGMEANRAIPGEDKQSNSGSSIGPQEPVSDIKDILGNNERQDKQKKKSADDDFSLDLGDDSNSGGEDISSIEDIKDDNMGGMELDESEECPNCKKDTDKIMYCPNCGTAFCNKCSKKQGDSYLCPKCGTKTSM